MKYFVYYQYDYYEMGGVGFKQFATEKEALAFIEDCLSQQDPDSDYSRGLADYTLIEGKSLRLKPVEHVTRIAISRGEDE